MDAAVPADRIAYAVIVLASLLLALGVAVLVTLDRRARHRRDELRDAARVRHEREQTDRLCLAITGESAARLAWERERLYRPRGERPTSS